MGCVGDSEADMHAVTSIASTDYVVDTFFDDWRDEGHRILVNTVRDRLDALAPAWARSIDDAALLDPLVVNALTVEAPQPLLEQLLWGLVAPHLRPALEVTVGDDGRVLVAGLGFFANALPGATATLVQRDGRPTLHEHPAAVLTTFPTAGALPVFPHRHPWLRPFIELQDVVYEDTAIDRPVVENLAPLTAALDWIARVAPRQHHEILRDTRLVILTQHERLLSAVGLCIHGAVIINVRGPSTPLFFVEELAHQCGHVTFGKVIVDWPKFLRVPYDTPMNVLGAAEDDTRSFGDALHGNYTLVRMLQLFDRILAHDLLAPGVYQELRGRACMAARRLEQGLPDLEDRRLYREHGWFVHQRLEHAFADVMSRLAPHVHGLDLSQQPYAFDLEQFDRRNPMTTT